MSLLLTDGGHFSAKALPVEVKVLILASVSIEIQRQYEITHVTSSGVG